MTSSKVLQIDVYSWIGRLHLEYWHVAQLRRMRVGERMMVGHHDTGIRQNGSSGVYQAYFERVRGGYQFHAHFCVQSNQPQPPSPVSIFGEFKLIDNNQVIISSAQEERYFRVICRYLAMQDSKSWGTWNSQVQKTNDRRLLMPQTWKGAHILKNGFTDRGIRVPSVQPANHEASEHKRIRLFKGREDLAHVYNRVNELVHQLKIYNMVQVDDLPNGVVRITLCNLWRIHRMANGSVRCFEFELSDMAWHTTTRLIGWPELHFWPINTNTLEKACESMYFTALSRVLVHAGFYDLSVRVDYRSPSNPTDSLRSAINFRYFYTKNALFKRNMPFRYLAKVIFNQIIDKPLFSTVLSSHWTRLGLRTYLHYAMKIEAVQRVAREHKNLFPLLEYIPKKLWSRSDLFAETNWLAHGSKDNILLWSQVKTDLAKDESTRFYGFHSVAAYRWLKKAPFSVVKVWSCGGRTGRHAHIIENIVKANITTKAPVTAWRYLLKHSSIFNEWGVHTNVQRFYRAFINHCAQLWQEKGFAEVKQFIRSHADFQSMRDWLRAEGFARGHPHKNATWDSLIRHSNDWHERMAMAEFRHDNVTWLSAIESVVIDGHEVKPLTSRYDLHLEGRHMHHCIANYTDLCMDGIYRVFSIKDADGVCSTLGLELYVTSKPKAEREWFIEQHQGPYNANINDSHQVIGMKVLQLYNQIYGVQKS